MTRAEHGRPLRAVARPRRKKSMTRVRLSASGGSGRRIGGGAPHQGSPFQASRPSLTATAVITIAAIETAQDHPNTSSARARGAAPRTKVHSSVCSRAVDPSISAGTRKQLPEAAAECGTYSACPGGNSRANRRINTYGWLWSRRNKPGKITGATPGRTQRRLMGVKGRVCHQARGSHDSRVVARISGPHVCSASPTCRHDLAHHHSERATP